MRIQGWPSGGALLALLAVANLLLGAGLFALRSPARRETSAPPPALPAEIAALAARLDGSHRGEPFALTLTDADLTAAVAAFLAASPDVPFSDVRVAARGGRIVVEGRARGAALAVPISATLAVAARDGTPIVRVEHVDLGGAPLPTFAREQIIAEANASLDLSRYDLGVRIDDLTVGEGVVAVRGAIK